MEKYLNYETLCRICLQETLDKEKGLFDILIDDVKYSDVIKLIAQIEIDPDDSLPSRLCGMCEDSLVDVYKLRELCIKSNDLLQMQENNSYEFKESMYANGEVDTLEDCVVQLPPIEESIEQKIINKNSKENKVEDTEDEIVIETVNGEIDRDPQPHVVYDCQTCLRTFVTLTEYEQHKKEEHPVVRRPHQCQKCPLRFSKRIDLIKHMKRHINPKIIKEIKQKLVQQNKKQREHQPTTTSKYSYKNIDPADKPFGCNQCPGRFTTEYYLKIHERIHTGVKPYVCRICGARFARSTYLRQHEKFHTGIRNHPCDLCPKRFYSSGDLRVHRRLHTGEKPFACEYCGGRYRRKADLKTHLKTHIGENTYLCNKCDASFRFSVELREHLRDHFLAEKQSTSQT